MGFKILNIAYDSEVDVLYFSKGAPSSGDVSDEVVIRKNPKPQVTNRGGPQASPVYLR